MGHIKINGEDVALEMLKRGLVQVREGGKCNNQAAYQDAQTAAQSKKVGMWDVAKKDKEVVELLQLKPLEIAEKLVG